ncbi:DUF4214 domain-containing protein [uncultured Marivita sp.]|uniref:DUF4214 domain-containing protein n=1 Tax=uncultured Marivita sp. TaxID=888080 RepID=UPI00263005DC|nr:DUF4214 domain-containing protein [uncultured Marivita sp.]
MPTVYGKGWAEELFPVSERDTLFLGNMGNDTIHPGVGEDTINGEIGNDWVSYNTLRDGEPFIDRGVEANLLTGSVFIHVNETPVRHVLENIENLAGSRFDDTLIGDNAANVFQGFDGNDMIRGLAGNDTIFPGDGNDTIYGNEGDDDLYAGRGDSLLHGGDGTDWAMFSTTTNNVPIFTGGVNVNLNHEIARVQTATATSTQTLRQIENVQGTDSADVLTGDATDNWLSGLHGDDVLIGAAGDDILFPDLGNDTADGGAGDDIIAYDFGSFDSGLTIDAAFGTTTGRANGQSFTDVFQNFEGYSGTRFADRMQGSGRAETIGGNEGDDTLIGSGGNDTLYGGDGVDIAIFNGDANRFTIEISLDGQPTRIVDRSGAAAIDIVEEIELIGFDDRLFTLIDEGRNSIIHSRNAGDLLSFLTEVYIVYFNRAPDAEGLHFWMDAFLNTHWAIDDLTQAFFDQPETRALYDGVPTASEFVERVYQNVLDRRPDAEGHAFWVDVLERGAVSEGRFIYEFLDGVKSFDPPDSSVAYVLQKSEDREYLNDKTALGLRYGATYGLNDVEMARQVMQIFDGSDATLRHALNQIDEAYAQALAIDGTGEFLVQLIGVTQQPIFDDG